MFEIGQKVVCVDDKFPLGIEELYCALPQEGKTYVVRGVGVGVDFNRNPGEIVVYLIGMRNPLSSTAPYPERGFKAERFVPLVMDETICEKEEEPDFVTA